MAMLLLSAADIQSVLHHAFNGIYAFCEGAGPIAAQQDADHLNRRLFTDLKGRFEKHLSPCLNCSTAS